MSNIRIYIYLQHSTRKDSCGSGGLEVEFALAIETAIKKVLKMPTSYSPRCKNVRIAHPKTFPYNIHFYIDEVNETVVFTAIIHNKREPKLAMNRV